MDRLKLKSERVEWRGVGEEIVALDVATETYLAVGPVGATVWRRLATGATLDELVAAVVAAYDVDEQTARGDLRSFLDELAARQLVDRLP